MRINWKDNTLFKFLIVGVFNTLVGCGTMFLLYNLAHCSYWVSSAANYIVGGIVSFFLNKYYTFGNKKWEWAQVWKFVLNVTVCYLLGYGLAKPITLDGYTIRPPKVRLLKAEGSIARFRVTIHEGRNRQVRRMCESAGMHCTRLRRIQEGGLSLGPLPVGKWRYLTEEEVKRLQK